MSERRKIAFFGGAWVAVVFLNAYIIAPAPLFPALMDALQVGNAAAGSLISILLLAAILAQIPGAYLIDRFDNRRIVLLSVLGLALASLPASLSREYGAILASRFVAGMFVPLLFVSLANLVSHAFPSTRVRALGVYLAAPPAGYALGTFLTPYLPAFFGLSAIFIVYALPIVVLLPVMYFASQDLVADRGGMLPLRDYLAAFRSWELWRLGLAFAATYALYILYTSWMPSLLATEGSFSAESAGLLAGLVPALGILSRPLGGYLADTRLRRDKRVVPLISFAALIPLSLAWGLSFALGWAAILLVLVGFFVQFPFSVYYAFSSQILPERLQGGAYTVMNTTSLIGGTLAPFAAGLLRDVTGLFLPVFLFAAALAGSGLLLMATSHER